MIEIPTMQTCAYCTSCATFHDPDDLVQSWQAVDELVCPDCGERVPERYQP